MLDMGPCDPTRVCSRCDPAPANATDGALNSDAVGRVAVVVTTFAILKDEVEVVASEMVVEVATKVAG